MHLRRDLSRLSVPSRQDVGQGVFGPHRRRLFRRRLGRRAGRVCLDDLKRELPATGWNYFTTECLASARAAARAFDSCASPSTIAANSASVPKPWALTVIVLSVC